MSIARTYLCPNISSKNEKTARRKARLLVGSVKCTLRNLNDKRGVRECKFFKVRGILDWSLAFIQRDTNLQTHGCWHVSASDTLDRSIKVIESLALNYLCADFATHAKHREAPLNND